MKKIKASKVISIILVAFIVLLLISPDTKAWVSRGLMKIGLFRPDLENKVVEAEPMVESTAAAKASAIFVDGEGKRIDAANQHGKVVFVNFWATWCPPCIAEMPSIDKLYAKFKDNEQVVFIIADVDNQYEKSHRFMIDKNYSLPVHVPGGDIPANWLGGAIPTTLILNKAGDIAMRHEGMADYGRQEVFDFIQGLIDE